MQDADLLRPEDWNFDEKVVPVDELRACLIWECTRECKDLAVAEWASDLIEQSQPTKWDKEAKKHVKNSARDRKVAAECLDWLDFDLDGHWKRLYSCHEAYTYALALERARPYSSPWQLLKKDFRKYAATQLGKSEMMKPFRPAALGQLEILWKENAKELIAIESGEKKAAYDDTTEMLRYEDVNPVEIPPGEGDPKTRELTAAFTVNFSLFSDREIADAFEAWLKQARLCPPPMRRGKKLNDDRAALDGIGMMRALHCFPFNSPHFPKPFKQRGARACYKGRKLALARFHELLPFVPQDSFPESWRTSSTRSMASKSD